MATKSFGKLVRVLTVGAVFTAVTLSAHANRSLTRATVHARELAPVPRVRSRRLQRARGDRGNNSAVTASDAVPVVFDAAPGVAATDDATAVDGNVAVTGITPTAPVVAQGTAVSAAALGIPASRVSRTSGSGCLGVPGSAVRRRRRFFEPVLRQRRWSLFFFVHRIAQIVRQTRGSDGPFVA